jgi:hypothetical protein
MRIAFAKARSMRDSTFKGANTPAVRVTVLSTREITNKRKRMARRFPSACAHKSRFNRSESSA